MPSSQGNTPDDYRTLIRQMAQGQETALVEFYRIFEQKIYAFAKIRLNDSQEASDLLHEVMWEVWRSAGRFEGRSSVSTWVFGIAHHKVIDRIRQANKHKTETLEGIHATESEEDLEALLTQKQMGEHIRWCIEMLSDDQRQVVHLAFYEGLPYREISKIVDSPEGTVKARMFHAKQALKRCMSRRLK
ncbi:RNA polymerase sigma factor [Candidatus Nitronereus thalassa]|uniref:RNA polymerase sigma factor n=1 Tax=Candidatus Nitronereus thalassa TaxID=3020898 RepID=A0ABU3K5P6_9BACT|nr:RNA polymerase sigma factor [Candidatus Nitronereus thalassa]MDT7041698.1 RNA polymerase sigma factor [Candidatus Nitronereus thalassa]